MLSQRLYIYRRSGGWSIEHRSTKNKFFGDAAYGGKDKSLEAARNYRDTVEIKADELPNKKIKTGVRGIRIKEKENRAGVFEYYIVFIKDGKTFESYVGNENTFKKNLQKKMAWAVQQKTESGQS